MDGLLDTSVSVRSILKYTGITLAFLVVLFSVFMLGRLSVDGKTAAGTSPTSMQLSGQTTQIVKNNPTTDNDSLSSVEMDELEDEEDVETETAQDEIIPLQVYETSEPEEPDEDMEEAEEDPVPDCAPEEAGFDYAYKNIVLDVSNFQRDNRGDNWATITSVKLTVTNNEACTIVNPTRLKIKLNAKGKGSVWWDDDVFLSDSFNRMRPGDTVTEIVPIHVSYSDVYSEKDLKISLFDEYDIHMATYQKYITFP
ncbi:hypothetical protein KY359_01540 [Candidatus Woesearchaeota archaeon]|nr:hypothetical protein [Candidatus Woesearchaeota archaeon]